jgi:type IV pilus assembly protein PilW
MKRKMLSQINNRGFTLTEILVVMAIAGIVIAGIYTMYSSQNRSYMTQEQIAAMQQNLRAATYFIEREIQMAGCDPSQTNAPGILTANKNSIHFTLDITDNAGTGPPDGDTGDPNEDITYSLYDSGGDGDFDLGRDTGGGNQALAENIDALDFVYLNSSGVPLDNDGFGNVTTDIPNIRSIQITMVAKTGRAERGYVDTSAYFNQVDLVNPILPAQNDNFRRKLITTEIKCRNLGL